LLGSGARGSNFARSRAPARRRQPSENQEGSIAQAFHCSDGKESGSNRPAPDNIKRRLRRKIPTHNNWNGLPCPNDSQPSQRKRRASALSGTVRRTPTVPRGIHTASPSPAPLPTPLSRPFPATLSRSHPVSPHATSPAKSNARHPSGPTQARSKNVRETTYI
jgi:hypothetical protein